MYRCFKDIPINARQYAASFEYGHAVQVDEDGFCPWGRVLQYLIPDPILAKAPYAGVVAERLARINICCLNTDDIRRFMNDVDAGRVKNVRRALGV